MSDLRELYQQVILDHQKKPRNFRALPMANRQAEGFNPLCGDKVHLYLKMENGVIQEVGFQGTGCAISTASASMMTESVKGKTPAEAEALFKKFQELVTGESGKSTPAPDSLAFASFLSASSAPPWPGTPSAPPSKEKRNRSARNNYEPHAHEPRPVGLIPIENG